MPERLSADEPFDEIIKRIAQEVVDLVQSNAAVDWEKEHVWASLRRHVQRLLTNHHSPPEMQEAAVWFVMQPCAELLAASAP